MRGDQNGNDRHIMTCLVEILQIESVVPDLVIVVAKKLFRADLELYYEYDGARYYHGVDSTAEARYNELKEDHSVDPSHC